MGGKKDLFLSRSNVRRNITKMFDFHVKSGGALKIDIFIQDVPTLMKNWDKIDEMDLYESLIFRDLPTEMEFINKEFFKEHSETYNAGHSKHTLTRLYDIQPEGYGLLDLHDDDAKSRITQNSDYRFDNSIPLYNQSGHNRQYDTTSEGLRGRNSIPSLVQQRYDMSLVHDNVDIPYKAIDYDVTPYYGRHDDEGHTAQLFTGFGQIKPE